MKNADVSIRSCGCTGASANAIASRSATRWRAGGEVAGWIIPSATLLLLPKCPACVAAYLALATGLGVTFSAAATLRSLVILFSVTMLFFVAARFWWRRRAGRS